VVEGKKVVGIITNRDLRFEEELDASQCQDDAA
jgi:CBS domain-containing protein